MTDRYHYVIAADQGGTKTRARLIRIWRDDRNAVSYEVLAEAKAGGGCWFYCGMEKSMGLLKEAIDETIEKAGEGLTYEDIDFLLVGAAGINWEHEKIMYTESAEKLLGIQTFAYNDGGVAIYCGTSAFERIAPNRILVCAGTEFVAAVVTEDDPEPYVYCNEIQLDPEVLGGNALGRAAIKAVVRAEQYLEKKTSMKDEVLAFFGLTSTTDLMQKFLWKQLGKAESELAPTVFAHAKAGDEVAITIIRELAEHIASYAIAAIDRYELHDKAVTVLMAGGLFKADYPAFKEEIRRLVMNAAGITANGKSAAGGNADINFIDSDLEPIDGAQFMAVDLWGRD